MDQMYYTCSALTATSFPVAASKSTDGGGKAPLSLAHEHRTVTQESSYALGIGLVADGSSPDLNMRVQERWVTPGLFGYGRIILRPDWPAESSCVSPERT